MYMIYEPYHNPDNGGGVDLERVDFVKKKNEVAVNQRRYY